MGSSKWGGTGGSKGGAGSQVSGGQRSCQVKGRKWEQRRRRQHQRLGSLPAGPIVRAPSFSRSGARDGAAPSGRRRPQPGVGGGGEAESEGRCWSVRRGEDEEEAERAQRPVTPMSPLRSGCAPSPTPPPPCSSSSRSPGLAGGSARAAWPASGLLCSPGHGRHGSEPLRGRAGRPRRCPLLSFSLRLSHGAAAILVSLLRGGAGFPSQRQHGPGRRHLKGQQPHY